MAMKPFATMLGISDGDVAYDTAAELLALITGAAHADFFKIWQKTVPAQQKIAWGSGNPSYQANQGYMWFASLDAGTDWDVGVLRLVASNARETQSIVVAEYPDDRLHSTTVTSVATAKLTDRNSMIALPIRQPLVREDSKLQLYYALLTAATAHDVAGFGIPATVFQ